MATEIFIVRDGARSGPHTLYQIRELLEEGEIDGSTLGWMRGEPGWVPLRELPPVLAMIQELEREKLDAALREEVRPPSPPPESTVPPQRLPSHAFARFGARMMDLLMIQLAVAAVWGLPDPPPGIREIGSLQDFWEFVKRGPTPEEAEYHQQLLYLKFGSIYAWHVIEPVFLAIFGCTPGKFLFRLQVVGPGGARPGVFRSFFRSAYVLLAGMGAGFEPIQWIANFFAFLRVQNRGVALWDQHLQTQVLQRPMTNNRLVLILVVFMILVAGRYFL